MLRGCIDCTDGLLVPHEEKFLVCSSNACRACMAQLVPTAMLGETASILSKFARMALHAYEHSSIPCAFCILSRALIGAIHRVPLSLRGRRHRYSMATKGSTQHR